MISARMEVACEAWGDTPGWIVALVNACDAKGASQNKVASKLGLSGAVVSQTIRNRYPGNMSNVEDRVRAIYLAGKITCPALGELGTGDCLRWRDKALRLTSASPITVRMFQACNNCPRHLKDMADVI